MADYITLMGADDVTRAGYSMASAAREMQSAASTFDHAVQMQQRFLDDWLSRLEAVLAASGSQ